jgi:putative transposase
VVAAGANRPDRKVGKDPGDSGVVKRPRPTPKRPQGRGLDKGYDYEEGRETLREFGFTAPIRARGEEAQALKRHAGFKARRWVVERAQRWMNRFRRVLSRWDKKVDNSLAFLHFAWALIAFRASGLFG